MLETGTLCHILPDKKVIYKIIEVSKNEINITKETNMIGYSYKLRDIDEPHIEISNVSEDNIFVIEK